MAVAGLCEHCDQRPGAFSCRRCGATVCRLHYDGELELCADCAQKRTADGRRGDTFRL